MNLSCDVCIVGNGAIGKAAALSLAQIGLKVSLLAPASPPNSKGGSASDEWDARVYAFNHTAKDLLTSIRVWDAMDRARIAPVDAMAIRGDSQRHPGRLTFDAYGARVDALAWIVEDANLNQALDAALKFASNVQTVTGKAVCLDQREDIASITLEDGRSIEASLVIGADGGQSWVRGQCDIGLDYRSYHQRAIVANFACEKPHHGVASQWFTSGSGVVALLPLPGNRMSLVWSAPDVLADQLLQESLRQLAQRVSSLPGQPYGTLEPLQPATVKAFPLALIRPHEIISTRVALIGDAAHVVHPLAGHGMNLGFADVSTLVKAIVDHGVQNDCGNERLLKRYARRRKEDVLLMQVATDGLERLFAVDLAPVGLIRNMGLSLVDQFGFVKRKFISHALGKPNFNISG
jgi:ubiquinone biosynthesis UbiH/UbiF/VisC/COQ6 family hydroxylase